MKVGNKKARKSKKKSQVLDQLQNLKIQQCIAKNKQKQKPYQEDVFYQNSSEANWQIKNTKYLTSDHFFDKKSAYSNFSTQSKQSLINTLCKALQILRNKMPQRSLEQIIIRLYQAAQLKRDLSSNGSIYRDNFSEVSRVHDFDGLQSQGEGCVKKQADNQDAIEELASYSAHDSERIKDTASGKKQFKQDSTLRVVEKSLKDFENPKQKNAEQKDLNYIYKPKGKQIVVKYSLKDTVRTKFVNIEEETRHKDQRFVAISFINRGYGVCQCRKEIQMQGINRFMHRDTYKALSTSMMIFAFRKLESFIAIQCGKKIKFIDRHQMQSIYITLLNCKVNMQAQFVITLMKYIKACYGLEEVVIGEIQSVKLYLTCQKYLYGKNVTMQFLEKLGQIKHKKQIQQTLQYINNRSMRYQQRLITLRRTRKQKKLKQMTSLNSTDNSSFNKSVFFPYLSELKAQTQSSSQLSSENFKPQATQLKEQQVEMDIEIEFAKEYIQSKELEKCVPRLKMRFVELDDWNQEYFEQLFYQTMRKSLQKIQFQGAIINDVRVKWVKILETQFFDKIVNSPFAELLRVKILSYLVQQQPNLRKLKEVITFIKGFVTEFQPYTTEQQQNQVQDIKKIIKETLIEPIKDIVKEENVSVQNSKQNYSQFLPTQLKSILEESNIEEQLLDFTNDQFGSTVRFKTTNDQFKDFQFEQKSCSAFPQSFAEDSSWDEKSKQPSNF